ncbi:unnamed protein product, partial [Meganyctiphanes norvegica]
YFQFNLQMIMLPLFRMYIVLKFIFTTACIIIGLYIMASTKHGQEGRIALTNTQTQSMVGSFKTLADAEAIASEVAVEEVAGVPVGSEPASINDTCSHQDWNWKLPGDVQRPIRLLTTDMLMSNSSPIVW